MLHEGYEHEYTNPVPAVRQEQTDCDDISWVFSVVKYTDNDFNEELAYHNLYQSIITMRGIKHKYRSPTIRMLGNVHAAVADSVSYLRGF